jgi:putative transposase
VLIRRGYRFRVYPTPAQEARLLRWESALRFLWNLANEQRLMGLARTDRIYQDAFGQRRELTQLRAELPWLSDVPRNACDAALEELDKAWQRCFSRSAMRPRWKKKGQSAPAIVEAHACDFAVAGSALRFPKLGPLRVVAHRVLDGKPRICALKRDGDQWFACITCEVEIPEPAPRTGPVIALDRGITSLLADSDGNLTANPRHYSKAMKRLAHAQRVVSRRKKGSRNRGKAKVRVMRLHRKVRRQREHFLHVQSARLAKSHGIVVIEKLNVGGMVRSKLARHIADAGWSAFANMLRYKLAWSGGTLIEVSAAYSSQTCAECGCVDAGSRKGEAFVCTGCGHVDHADLNAAKILKSRANRSALPVEGLVPETARRSRKAKVKLRAPRRRAPQSVVA